MENEPYNDSVIGTATDTNKSENQDSKSEFEESGFKAIFIADGLGSVKYPKHSSERITNFCKEKAVELKSLNIKFEETFAQARQKLIDFSNEFLKEEEKSEEDLFGTTLIAVVETQEKISIGYVGNGAVWHIRGNFTEFAANYPFPWNAVNYLNPHTIPEAGKEALYRLISIGPDVNECNPSTVEIIKDKEYGEIIVICTDGIYSADQLKTGKNEKGVWVRYEASMLKLFDHLNQFFKNNEIYNKDGIEQLLIKYLEELRPTLDDDATIGILVTKEALNYQNKINWLIQNEENTNN